MVSARSQVTERLAMALYAKQDRGGRRVAQIRKDWAAASWSLKDVYLGAASEVLRDGGKLGLRFTLKVKP